MWQVEHGTFLQSLLWQFREMSSPVTVNRVAMVIKMIFVQFQLFNTSLSIVRGQVWVI